MNQISATCPTPSQPSFTPKQGQYLAFIYAYTQVLGKPPAEADLQRATADAHRDMLTRAIEDLERRIALLSR